jgi:CDI immunity proteins
MTEADLEDFEDQRFFALVGLGGLPPKGTLEGASGVQADEGPYATRLIERVRRAWRTPYPELTCEQVRTLLGQKMGLEWLAEPILRFIGRYPMATITNYPGEMSLLTLRAAEEFLSFAPHSFQAWLNSDLGWLDEAFGWSRQLRREADEALCSARARAGQ